MSDQINHMTEKTAGMTWQKLLLLYSVSHGFLILCWNALFWDDWMIYSRGSEFTKSWFAACERCVLPFRGEYEALLLTVGPWLFHLLTFLMWPVCGFLIERVLTTLAVWPRDNMRMIVAAFVLTPAYGARVALINFQYTQSLLLFLLGTWLVLQRRTIFRIIGVLPLFWSMFVQSFQVFIVVTICLLSLKHRYLFIRKPLTVIPGLVLLLSFPFLHRYVIPQILPNLQVADGYNAIHPIFLVRAILICSVILMPAILMALKARRGKSASVPCQLFAVGCGLLALGSFPYLAVGHFSNFSDWVLPFLPDQSDWNSRHQLIQTIGLSVLTAAVVEMLGQRRLRAAAVVIVVSACLNVAIYSGYYLDWLKQRAFIAEVAEIRTRFSAGDAVIISDLARDFNARGRGVRAYEWEGMVAQATGLNITADSESLAFCSEHEPRYQLTIAPTSGRLKALISNSIVLQVSLTELPMCSSTE